MEFIFLARRVTNFKMLTSVLLAALCVSCSSTQSARERQNNSNTDEANNAAPVTVTAGKAVAREIPAVIQATGSLVAEESSDIAPKVAGKVTNIYANVGQFVSQGAVIAKLDENDARLRLAEARANVNQAIAGVRQAEARLGLAPNGSFNATTIPEVRVANANYERALAELRQAEVSLQQAEVNERRYRELVTTGDTPMITYEQFRTARDVARTARDTARANVNAAKQTLEGAINTAKQNNQAIKSAEAAVESARTQIGIAEQGVADTTIRAPFSGYISQRQTAVGEFVTSSTAIATILRTNPIKIQIQIPESDVPYVGIGRGVSVAVDAYKDRNFAGTVIAVNPAIDPTSRSAVVEATIENGDNALRTGMFATAKITRNGGSTGVFVPKTAVYEDKATQSQRVFVIQEGIAKLRTVQLGTEEGDSYQILVGVNADETVATSNLEQLYEGAKVSVQ
ncbi:MAG: efflux RND transporter periplasmic adaptor subunit [Pyrinomonadaceae bacterium]|nr:efflux RND transporter periplasmic adaptor subunit [Pyrinomonadaceae bacterium]